MKHFPLVCLAIVVTLGRSFAAELEIDYFWRLQAPDGWKVKIISNGDDLSYLCSPDLKDGATRFQHFYISDVIRSPELEPLYCRGFRAAFSKSKSQWIMPPPHRREQIEFAGKSRSVDVYESKAPGRKFYNYQLITDTKEAYGFDSYGEPERLVINFYFYTPEELAEYIKLAQNIRRKS